MKSVITQYNEIWMSNGIFKFVQINMKHLLYCAQKNVHRPIQHNLFSMALNHFQGSVTIFFTNCIESIGPAIYTQPVNHNVC